MPVRTSQEKHYFSATGSNRLMLCEVGGFHGGDYEECRLLGYTNPVRSSQKTHNVSATESSRLMLCEVGGFPDGDPNSAVLRDVSPRGSCNGRCF
jgi:hypothetical protein